jgi:hypothetical protein
MDGYEINENSRSQSKKRSEEEWQSVERDAPSWSSSI